MAFGVARAQQTPAIAPLTISAAAPSSVVPGVDSPVTGRPLAQTEKQTTARTGADGTQFTSIWETHRYRDVEGRVRTTKSSVQHDGSSRIMSDTIDDPVARLHITLNATAKTATVYHAPETTNARKLAEPVSQEKIAERKKAATERQASPQLKYGFNREKLPSKQIAGVYAEGERITMTVPAGAQDNDREFTIVTETWTSPELKTMLYRSTQDPHFGNMTDEVTELSRADPDPSLFQVPAGYKVQEITPRTAKLQ